MNKIKDSKPVKKELLEEVDKELDEVWKFADDNHIYFEQAQKVLSNRMTLDEAIKEYVVSELKLVEDK